MAHALTVRGVDWRDLFQEGALGLLQAIRRFDPSRGVRLSTYAAHWIRAFQFRFLLANYRLVRLGRSHGERRIFFRLSKIQSQLAATGGEVSPERIAALLDVDEASVRTMQSRMSAREVSLDSRGSADDERAATLLDRLPGDLPAADDALAAAELADIVRQERDEYRASLPARRLALFDARWMDDDRATLQEMGDRLGVSRERARQLEQKMLGELGARVRHHAAP
jgi:RNA polymerase sigma-32 factor